MTWTIWGSLWTVSCGLPWVYSFRPHSLQDNTNNFYNGLAFPTIDLDNFRVYILIFWLHSRSGLTFRIYEVSIGQWSSMPYLYTVISRTCTHSSRSSVQLNLCLTMIDEWKQIFVCDSLDCELVRLLEYHRGSWTNLSTITLFFEASWGILGLGIPNFVKC